MINIITDKIISYIYNISNQPVKLIPLLEANQLFNEGMKLDGSKLGFRINLFKAYFIFLALSHIIILPIGYIFHNIFKNMDCHASIILVIFFTVLLFGIFSFFKEWTRDAVSKKRIKEIWELHFPLFSYDEYNKEVAKIYQIALEDEIKHSDLERFILDKLSE